MLFFHNSENLWRGAQEPFGGHGTPVLPFDDMPVKKRRFNTELRQHFFTDRIINLWNSLDEQIVSSTSLNCFKNGLELMGHVQSCFGYSSPEAEPVPPLVRPRPGEIR